jgi:hypothetical protein
LHLLTNWWVIAAALALFAVDFFADKIPAFDVVWNALHTFIRVPVAALMAFQAASNLSPGEQLVATLAGGMIAFIAHGGKTAARVAVTPSPEPFSNIALSMGGDALAVGLTWLSTWRGAGGGRDGDHPLDVARDECDAAQASREGGRRVEACTARRPVRAWTPARQPVKRPALHTHQMCAPAPRVSDEEPPPR